MGCGGSSGSAFCSIRVFGWFWLFTVDVCVRCRGGVMPGCSALCISSFGDHISSLLW